MVQPHPHRRQLLRRRPAQVRLVRHLPPPRGPCWQRRRRLLQARRLPRVHASRSHTRAAPSDPRVRAARTARTTRSDHRTARACCGRYLKHFKNHPRTHRRQLLVLAFESVLADTAKAIELISTHYGLPQVLTGATPRGARIAARAMHGAPPRQRHCACCCRSSPGWPSCQRTTRATRPTRSCRSSARRASLARTRTRRRRFTRWLRSQNVPQSVPSAPPLHATACTWMRQVRGPQHEAVPGARRRPPPRLDAQDRAPLPQV